MDLKPSTSFPQKSSSYDPPPYSAVPASGKERLYGLAKELDVELSVTMPSIVHKDYRASWVTDADRTAAIKLLNERRLTDPDYKAPSGISKLMKSKTKIAEISPKEVSRAFSATVQQGGPLGVVEALLEMGADVDVSRRASTSLMKKLSNKDQQDQKSWALQIATRNHGIELVDLLASRAGQGTLDESLVIAVAANQTEKVRVLLEYGASIREAHEAFSIATSQSPEDLVMLLLSAGKGPCDECRAIGLVKAVERRTLTLINSFLQSNADTSYQNAEALLQAIRNVDVAAAITIAVCAKPPSPELLDNAAALAFQQPHARETRLRLVEICLCGGARGTHTQCLLVEVTEAGDIEMVHLLLKHNVSLNYNGGQALCSAVDLEFEEIFDAMLDESLDESALGNALTSAARAPKLGLEFTGKLLKRGASPSYKNGQPMIAAVSLMRIHILEKMLSKRPQGAALNATLSACLKLSGKARIDAITTLTPAKIEQSALDAGLVTLAEELTPQHEAMTALMSVGALPDAHNAKSVVCVACRYDVDTLTLLASSVSAPSFSYSVAAEAVSELRTWRDPQGLSTLQFLLEHGADPEVLDNAVREAAKVFESQALSFLSDWIESSEIYTVAFADAIEIGNGLTWLQTDNFDTMQLLLDKGAHGPVVDAALTQAVSAFLETQADEILVDVLLDHGADINYQDGLCLDIAVRAGALAVVEKLLKFNPTTSSLSIAFSTALTCDHPVQVVIGLLELLAVKEGTKADVNYMLSDTSPLVLALQMYPSSVPLIKRMCELGCEVNAQLTYKVYGDGKYDDDMGNNPNNYNSQVMSKGDGCECDDCQITQTAYTGSFDVEKEMEIGDESVSVLTWACCQTGDRAISTPVVEVLLAFQGLLQKSLFCALY